LSVVTADLSWKRASRTSDPTLKTIGVLAHALGAVLRIAAR
jgi:hypothetical protein